tara:strand:+ start:409 stop:594 length:186 start_codon:yes stop_codon:yes gene_type:complete
MSKVNFSDDFKRDAVAQIIERAILLRRFHSAWGSASTRYMLGRRSSLRLLAAMLKMPRSGD